MLNKGWDARMLQTIAFIDIFNKLQNISVGHMILLEIALTQLVTILFRFFFKVYFSKLQFVLLTL